MDYKATETADNVMPCIVAQVPNREGERDRKGTEQSFLVPKQEIVDNGYDLSINKYKQVEYTPVEYPPTSEILKELRDLEAEISKGLDELEGMV